MWNTFETDGELGLEAGITTFPGGNGDVIHAYIARSTSTAPMPGVLMIHHAPGWDEISFEDAERLARHGYDVICPDLYCRFGHGKSDDVTARVRAAGGVTDESVIADCAAALAYLQARPTANGKVGVMGPCSGGRHSVLAASVLTGFDAAVDLWGGNVLTPASDATPARPVAPIEYTKDLSAPLLGIFGADDPNPNPEMVAAHEAELIKFGKEYEFHSYDGAPHGFFNYDKPAYRQEQAMDGWNKVFRFLDEKLKS